MRKLASIQEIKALHPIPGADLIVEAEILGWKLIVKKDEFKVGDFCVYCEIDSILPELPPFEFLRKKAFRIKTLKMRGKISQGIAFPLTILKEVAPSFDLSKVEIDQDVTDTMKIVKYESADDADLPLEEPEVRKRSWVSKKLSYLRWKLFGFHPIKKAGSFPPDVPKTDETRVQNMSVALERREGMPCYITEKVEGTSSTFVCKFNKGNWFSKIIGKMDYQFLVCSRNNIIYNSLNHKGLDCNYSIFKVAQKYDLENRMRQVLKGRNLAIQGETIGPKIQGNIYRIPEVDFRVFLIWDIDNKKYLSLEEMQNICDELEIPMAPVLESNHILISDVNHYVKMSRGNSKINPTKMREGIVVRSHNENFSFKSVDPEYLLNQPDEF